MVRLVEPEGAVRLRIGAVGDVGIVGPARDRARANGYAALLAPIGEVLSAQDTGFANLEFPVAEPGWMLPGRTATFWHEPGVAAGLFAAGIRVVSLANNHLMDAGERGLAATLAACRDAGLHAIGAGRDLAEARTPARLTLAGREVVFLAYGAAAAADRAQAARAGVAPLEPELIREDVARWRGAADTLVVSVHWGSMYVEHPPERVVSLAAELAAAGVDLVLGHHPHVLQGFRRDGRTLTLFSMGDAAFDSGSGEIAIEWTRELRRSSGVFVASIAERPGLDVHPLMLDEAGVPAPASDEDARRIAARLAELGAAGGQASEAARGEAASSLMRYELGALKEYVKRGQLGRAARLLASVRPRHAATLLRALTARRARRPGA
jgi:poly-gamma-glutamate synthesis protein (capsule biosynthesis protein)